MDGWSLDWVGLGRAAECRGNSDDEGFGMIEEIATTTINFGTAGDHRAECAW